MRSYRRYDLTIALLTYVGLFVIFAFTIVYVYLTYTRAQARLKRAQINVKLAAQALCAASAADNSSVISAFLNANPENRATVARFCSSIG